MHPRHHSHHAFHRAKRDSFEALHNIQNDNPPIVSELMSTKSLEFTTPVLHRRETCLPNDTSAACEKPTKVNSLPIILGAALPIIAAAIVLIYLHRRHIKKLRQEDAHDESKYKSMDFGMDGTGPMARKKKPGLSIDPEKYSHGKGLSMDMDMNSPYILPPAMHGSRDSLHSLSRSLQDNNDPYRPVTFIKDDEVLRSPVRIKADNQSTYTVSSIGTERLGAGLLRNAQRMSTSTPPRSETSSPQDKATPQIILPGQGVTTDAPILTPPPLAATRDSYMDKNVEAMRKSNNYLGSYIQSDEPAAAPNASTTTAPSLTIDVARAQSPFSDETELHPSPLVPKSPRVVPESAPNAPASNAGTSPFPQRVQSQQVSVHNLNTMSMISDSSDYGDGFKVTPPSPRSSDVPRVSIQKESEPAHMPTVQEHQAPPQQHTGLGVHDIEFQSKRLSVSLRPLPIEDPSDNPEQRANRIRSFYKEYFDDSKPDPQGEYQGFTGGNSAGGGGGGGGGGGYYEDYDQQYLEGTVFDPQTGNFVVAAAPFAEPVTRRAMTPPPRAPPRFQGHSHGHPRGNMSVSSGNRFMTPPPPRGRSAMSSRSAPKKALPPPSPLSGLPTPHLLKEDSMVFNPIDFAPPATYRERQNGRRPDSPMGVARPYSPSVAAHNPLASAFDDLSSMPSPHALRKSGTFTALDFAPPPRFRTTDTASDSGSIRSNRSGVSAMQLHSIRNGAYRVSRIPKGVVGTKDDITTSLKPTWDLRGPV